MGDPRAPQASPWTGDGHESGQIFLGCVSHRRGNGVLHSERLDRIGPQGSLKSAVDASPVDTDDLIRRILAGETALYGVIVRTFSPDVLRIVILMLADRVQTENIVQQTFVNAFEHLHEFRIGEDFGRWVRTIARNLVRDELRRSMREKGRMARYRSYLLSKFSADDQGEKREQLLTEVLGNCRGKLNPLAAQALRLRYEEELPFNEVAAAIGRSPDATRQIVSRARVALRTCMQEQLEEPWNESSI
jgi:RNA polymerase sigma-70 factor (ECF subfamily)